MLPPISICAGSGFLRSLDFYSDFKGAFIAVSLLSRWRHCCSARQAARESLHLRKPSHRVYLVDTFNGIGNHVVSDGVHLSSTGLANWYQALLDHAQTYALSE